jgi:hypothetical protein
MEGLTEKKQRVRTLTKKDIEIKLSKKFEVRRLMRRLLWMLYLTAYASF